MTLAVLITNYNAWSVTAETVRAVLQHSGHAVRRVLVVDDASDVPPSWREEGQVTIVRNPTNMGYAASVNIGMALLDEEVIVILDCDARPLNDFSGPVIKAFAEQAGLGEVGFDQTDSSGARRPAGEPMPSLAEFVLGSPLYSKLPRGLVRRLFAPPREVQCLHSCCCAVRNRAFQEVRGFDTGFDFLDADIDFSLRLNQQGWQTALLPEVLCFHPGSGSPQSVSKRVLRHHRNRWRLFEKHGLFPLPRLVAWLLMARHLVEILALLLLRLKAPGKAGVLQDKWRSRMALLRTAKHRYQTPSSL